MIALDGPRRGWNGAERALFGALLCVGYFLLEIGGGSGVAFSALMALYVLSVILAIRAQGGIATLFGALVFWYAFQHVLVSQVLKVILGERPDSRLEVPVPTIFSEILLMLGFAAAGLVASKIRPNRGRPLFPPVSDPSRLRQLAIASTILAVLRNAMLFLNISLGPVHLLSIIDYVAIMSAVGVAVTETRGRRLTNALAWVTITPLLFLSLIAGARGAMVFLALSIMIAGSSFGYKFKPATYAVLAALGLFFFFVVSPYSLASRSVNRTTDFVHNVNTSIDVFGNVLANPLKYQFAPPSEAIQVPKAIRKGWYYNLRPGNAEDALGRMALIRPNDLIVDDTLKNGYTKWTGIVPALPDLLPEFLNSDKNNWIGTGNALAHRTELLSPRGDRSTGITIGLTADAFGAFSWLGALLLPFFALLFDVVVYKLIISLDLTRNVFALALFLASLNNISESTFVGVLRMGTWSAALFVIGFYAVIRTSELLDFKRLRPRRLPLGWPDESAASTNPSP